MLLFYLEGVITGCEVGREGTDFSHLNDYSLWLSFHFISSVPFSSNVIDLLIIPNKIIATGVCGEKNIFPVLCPWRLMEGL